jgi:uncharacterized phage infection (PIP) family protein YhgE
MNTKNIDEDTPEELPNENTSDEGHSELHDDFDDLGADQFDDYDVTDVEENPEGLTGESAPANTDEAPIEEEMKAPTSLAAKKSFVDLLKENWLFVAIGLGVVLIAGYLIYGILAPNPPAAPQQQSTGSFALPQQSQTVPTATTANTASAVPTGTATPDASAVTNIVMNANDMKQLMQGFQQMVQQNSQELQKNLQTAINNASQANNYTQAIDSLSQAFLNLNQKLNNYDQTIAALNNRLNTLQTQLTILVAQQTAQQQKLTLRAVVPGRAWLIDGSGRTISVTEGTALGNFGTVTTIDSTKGEVMTSSGYIFK